MEVDKAVKDNTASPRLTLLELEVEAVTRTVNQSTNWSPIAGWIGILALTVFLGIRVLPEPVKSGTFPGQTFKFLPGTVTGTTAVDVEVLAKLA